MNSFSLNCSFSLRKGGKSSQSPILFNLSLWGSSSGEPKSCYGYHVLRGWACNTIKNLVWAKSARTCDIKCLPTASCANWESATKSVTKLCLREQSAWKILILKNRSLVKENAGGAIPCSVTVDGTWRKRGHTSKIGASFCYLFWYWRNFGLSFVWN